MKLDLERQPSGRSQLAVAGSITFRSREDEPAAVEFAGELTVDNLDGRLVVTGSLNATVSASCDRCLEPFDLDYEVPVELMILKDRAVEGEPDSCVIHQRTGEVDLTGPLREAILLALPQKRLCSQECRGLCPVCGANRSRKPCDCKEDRSDPRWDGLPTA